MPTKNYNLSLKDINPKLAKEVSRTKKGMIELERSEKIERLRKAGQVTDMFKTMFGQDK